MRQREYFVRAGELANELSNYNQANATTAALELLSNVLEKMPSSNGETDITQSIVAADLGAVEKIVQFLLAEGNLPFGSPSEKVLQLSRILGRVRQEYMPGHIPRPVKRNITPPSAGEGIRVSGMDPKDIEDPTDRKTYEAAIRENSLNNVVNQRQEWLHQLEWTYAPQIVALVRRASIDGKVPVDVIQKAVVEARMTDDEKTGVIIQTQ